MSAYMTAKFVPELRKLCGCDAISRLSNDEFLACLNRERLWLSGRLSPTLIVPMTHTVRYRLAPLASVRTMARNLVAWRTIFRSLTFGVELLFVLFAGGFAIAFA